MGKHHKRSPAHDNMALLVVGGVTTAALAASGSVAQASPHAVESLVSTTGIDWSPIVACESGGNPTVVNSTGHAGLLQFSAATWLRYGGGQYAPTANLATPAQQLAVADVAYAVNGLNDWAASRSCWEGKVHGATSTHVEVKAPVPVVLGKHASGRDPAPRPHPTVARHGKVTVVSGDTLSQIAVDHGQDWPDVYAANRDVIKGSADLIFPGQVIAL